MCCVCVCTDLITCCRCVIGYMLCVVCVYTDLIIRCRCVFGCILCIQKCLEMPLPAVFRFLNSPCSLHTHSFTHTCIHTQTHTQTNANTHAGCAHCQAHVCVVWWVRTRMRICSWLLQLHLFRLPSCSQVCVCVVCMCVRVCACVSAACVCIKMCTCVRVCVYMCLHVFVSV